MSTVSLRGSQRAGGDSPRAPFSIQYVAPCDIFIGSANWRGRNLNERVETMAPVLDPGLRERLVQILHYALNDNRLAWDLRADGQYVQRRPEPGEPEVNYQELLMRDAVGRSRAPAARPWELTV